VAGVAGGVYLGHGKDVQQRAAQAQLVVQSDSYEMQLLKQRQNEHAAARAYQRQAESEAAAKAATEARAAASRARALEAKIIAKKEAARKAAEAAKQQQQPSSSSSGGGTVPYAGPIPSSCNSYSGNRATGCALMLDAGFKIDQFPCLDKLWTRESGWNHRASNASTGAYGIPQALPGSKMGTVASDWRTNPATQIKWGLNYMNNRYGSPCEAWAFWQANGSY